VSPVRYVNRPRPAVGQGTRSGRWNSHPCLIGRRQPQPTRPANCDAKGRPEFGIDFERPDGASVGFEYASLVRREYAAGRIVLTFLADEPVRVTITGRGLRHLYELIRGHRVAVVHVAARDMGQDGEPVVTEVKIEKPDGAVGD
jgi:hypothetical protein